MTDERTTTGVQRRIVLKGVTGAVAAGLVSVGASAGTAQEARGGPVILLGLDSELTPDDPDHGTRAEHAAMIDALLNDVTADGEGLCVVGAKPDGDAGTSQRYWEDVGADLGEPVTFVNGADEIAAVDFDDYALLGVASSDYQLEPIGEWGEPPEGLVDAENEALVERSEELAEFVNAGGGLVGKTQDGLTTPYGYVDPLGEFETAVGIDDEGYVDIEVAAAGEALGLTQDGMSGWCCWHDVFRDYPDFLDVLVYNREAGSDGENDAAAVGGVVVIPVDVAVSIDGPDETAPGESATYAVRVENIGDEDLPEDVRVEVTLSRPEGIDDGDVDLAYAEANDEWAELQLQHANEALSGTPGPTDGIPLPVDEAETIDLQATFETTAEFVLDVDVVGVGDEAEHYANASQTVAVQDDDEDGWPDEDDVQQWPDSCDELEDDDEAGDDYLLAVDGNPYQSLLSPEGRDSMRVDLQNGEFAAVSARFDMSEELRLYDDGDISLSLLDGDPITDLVNVGDDGAGRSRYEFYEPGEYAFLLFAEVDTPCIELYTADDSAGSWGLALEEGADDPPIEPTDLVDEREDDD